MNRQLITTTPNSQKMIDSVHLSESHFYKQYFHITKFTLSTLILSQRGGEMSLNMIEFFINITRTEDAHLIYFEQFILQPVIGVQNYSKCFWTLDQLQRELSSPIKFSSLLAIFHLEFTQFQLQEGPPKITTHEGNEEKQVILQLCMHQLQLKCRFITDLRLTHCALGDYSIKEISKINLMFLVTLDLTHNNITAEGVHTLVKDPGCAYKYLQVLYLGYNRIKNKGLKYVSQAHWLKLHTLNLCSISPTNDGLKYLQNLPFPLLRELIFYNNHIQLDSLSLLLKARSKTILLSCVSLRGKGKLECICCSENLVFKNYVVKLKGTVIQDGVSALLKTFRSRLTY